MIFCEERKDSERESDELLIYLYRTVLLEQSYLNKVFIRIVNCCLFVKQMLYLFFYRKF